MINNNVKKQYPVIRMPNGHPISATMYNRGDLHGVVYSNDIEFDDVLLSNVITTSTIVANLNVSTTVSSNILSSGLLLGTVTVSKLVNSAISTTSNITADVKLVYNLLSSLTTSSSVVGNLTIPKLVSTSLVSTGTIVADLSVSSATSSLLLDTYPNAAAAYSLRKLRTAYTGSAVRVRRSSDNTEQNIGFIGNDLDTTALTTFCGAGNGFVTTWYDQSGNARNATQETGLDQPQIVISGVVVLDNSKPSISFNNNELKTSVFTLSSQPITRIVVVNPANFNNDVFIDGSTTNRGRVGGGLDNLIFAGVILAFGQRILAQQLVYALFNSTTSQIIRNGTILGTGDAGTNGLDQITIGMHPTRVINYNGRIQEVIVYASNQASNRLGIQTNINTNYAIY